MMRLFPTSHGRAAVGTLRDRIAEAKAGDPMAPVTVVVADNAIGVSARRSIAGGDHGPVTGTTAGLAGVTFLTVFRLAEILGAGSLAAQGRRPVSTPVIASAIRRVLASEPGVFAGVADHPTTEKRLVRAHRELADLDARELDLLAASPIPRVRDVIRVHRAARRLLVRRWYDEQDLVDAAIVNLNGAPFELGTVILFVPRDLSVPRARLLRRLADHTPVEVVAASTGVAEADRPMVLVLDRLGLGQQALHAALPDTDQLWSTPGADIEVTSASDPDDEVRQVVRGVMAAAGAGSSLDAMAIVHAADVPYRRLLHDHLTAAGIAINGPSPTTVAESVAGRSLRRLLALVDRGFRRDDVIGLVASCPIVWAGRRAPSRSWDRISREAGVTRGLDDWHDRLARWMADARDDLERLGEDPQWEARMRRLRRDLDHAAGLGRFVAELADDLGQARTAARWSERVGWCRRLLRTRLEDPTDWPDAERRARDRIDAILDRLAVLDAVEDAPTMEVFRRTLELELEAAGVRTGTVGSGVYVGDPRMAVGLDLDHVWIVGLADGLFPGRFREDSLLPDSERASVAGLSSAMDRTTDQYQSYLAVLAAAGGGTAHLSWPRGDLRRAEHRTPGRWLLDTIAQRLGRRIGPDALDPPPAPWITHIPSFAAGLLGAPQPATAQEHHVRLLVELTGTGVDPLEQYDDPALDAAAALTAARGGLALSRFDGLVGPIDGPGDPTRTGRPVSATSLETYARCPHQYFVRHVLGVEPLDAPERRVRIDALERGSLVHRILERFVGEVATSGGSWRDLQRQRLSEITEEEFAAAAASGVTGAPLYWRRDQVLLRRDLERVFEIDVRRRRTEDLVPIATEFPFGLRDTDPVPITLPDGRTLFLRGSIDLVDRGADGRLVVTDYKTGRLTKVHESDPHQRGTKLQLALYGIVARQLLGPGDGVPVQSRYWHINAKERYGDTGYEVSDDVTVAVLGAVTTIVDLIAQGVFPQHPEENTRTKWVGCPYCEPDGLGVAEARRRYERKVTDPHLAAYVELAEPDLLPGSDTEDTER